MKKSFYYVICVIFVFSVYVYNTGIFVFSYRPAEYEYALHRTFIMEFKRLFYLYGMNPAVIFIVSSAGGYAVLKFMQFLKKE